MCAIGHSVTAKDSISNNTVSSLTWLHDSPGVSKDKNILWSEGREFTGKYKFRMAIGNYGPKKCALVQKNGNIQQVKDGGLAGAFR
jgi:hypothetical protein